MAQYEGGLLSRLFNAVVARPIGWVIERSFDLFEMGPSVIEKSQWLEPAQEYDDVPTDELIPQVDRDKVIHLAHLFRIADDLSFQHKDYFISKKDTQTFLHPLAYGLSDKAKAGEIESWHKKDIENRTIGALHIRAGALIDHLKEDPIPGDNWEVTTLEKKAALFAGLRHIPMQLSKLFVVSAMLAEDKRPEIEGNAEAYQHQPQGTASPANVGQDMAPKPSQ